MIEKQDMTVIVGEKDHKNLVEVCELAKNKMVEMGLKPPYEDIKWMNIGIFINRVLTDIQ